MSGAAQTRPAEVDPLVLSRRAGAGSRLAALAIDVLPSVALGAAAVALFRAGLVAAGWASLLAAVLLVVIAVVMTARTGQSAGRRATGIRTVVRSSGTAPGGGLLAAFFTGRLATFDVRRGRDPFGPALAPLKFPEPAAAAVTAAPVMRSGGGAFPVIELDSGQRFTLETAVVIGRSPVSSPAESADAFHSSPAEPAVVYRWADMSRTLSKSHARIEWDGRAVWVTDLGSTNGTAMRMPSGPRALVPFQRTPLPLGAVLELGDRVVTVGAAR